MTLRRHGVKLSPKTNLRIMKQISILAGAICAVVLCITPLVDGAEPPDPASLLTPEELKFLGSHDHRLHAAGAAPLSGRLGKVAPKRGIEDYTTQTDRAWVVMLYKKKLIPRDVAAKVLAALEQKPGGDKPSAASSGSRTGSRGATFASGEDALKKKLGDEDLASVVNYGRTRQEPMSRLLLRDYQLDSLDALLGALEATLDVAEAHAETIMPGSTHMAHAQPTTYGAYVLAIHDGLVRSLEQLELAYRQTNENTVGCAAVSGTGWPVDRRMVTDLLGFDALMEPTYQCEGAQDYGLTTLFALVNTMTVLSRTMMDHSIWGMEDCGFLTLPGRLLGISSLMPQKAHPGSAFERIRVRAARVIGHMNAGVAGCNAEPLTDVLPIYEAWTQASEALEASEESLNGFSDILRNVQLNKAKMLQHTRDGFSCTPDLAVKLIREKGYGGRRAHRICAVFVYLARKQGLKPHETTGALLDQAAKVANEKPPGLTIEEIREIFDPVKFLERHNNVGDPNPQETRRLIGVRRAGLAELTKRQTQRRAKLQRASELLTTETTAIIRDK
jgi:argininosuccinate lyase